MPDPYAGLTEAQRWDLYNKCGDAAGFNVLGAIDFFVGMATADVPAVLQPFIDGMRGNGCDVFLTDQMKLEQAEAQHQEVVAHPIKQGQE